LSSTTFFLSNYQFFYAEPSLNLLVTCSFIVKVPDQEIAKGPFGIRVKLPPAAARLTTQR